MNDRHPQPTTTAPAEPVAAPRLISHAAMREHLDDGCAVALSDLDRFGMFVRHDNTWWVRGADTFVEITDAQQNTKLDRWHRRLTDGALWD